VPVDVGVLEGEIAEVGRAHEANRRLGPPSLQSGVLVQSVVAHFSGMSPRDMPDPMGTSSSAARSFWAHRRVLVTGGCGFIGSHLVEALLATDAEVVVLDMYNSASSKGFLGNVASRALDIRLGDVADPFLVREMAEGVDTIFHLAALIGIPYSYVAPAHYVRTNIDGTLAVLEAARAERLRRVVHTSTSETYGSAQYEPMDEAHPIVAQSPYAATKIAADQLASSYFRSFDLPITTLRPFNTFGPRQSMRAVMPTLMAQALYADRIVVGALEPVRDMNYVGDTVAAFLGVGAALDVEGELFNVGSGIGRTIAEMATVVQRVAGVDKPVEQSEARLRPERSEVRALICEYGKAQRAFGYEPRVEFEDGVAKLRDHLVAVHPRSDVDVYHV
jgi:nucleoside-diphosphate-sugar epimerase